MILLVIPVLLQFCPGKASEGRNVQATAIKHVRITK